LRVRAVLLISLVVASTVITGLIFVSPPLDDFWLENPFWNGLSEVYSGTHPVRLGNLTSLRSVVDPSACTVLMLGPSEPFTTGQIEAVRAFLVSGGRVVLADDFGTGNSLLQGLDLQVRFSGLLLLDPLFKEKNSRMPCVSNLSSSPSTEELEGLTLNYPTVLNNTDGVSVLAWSTSFSYLAAAPSPPTNDSATGPFPVVAEVKMGEGSLILISDSSLFINSMLDRGDNMALLEGLAGDTVYLDEVHSMPSRLARVRMFLAEVYSLLSMTEVRYALTGLLVLAVVKVEWTGEREQKDERQVEAVLRRHPEWDRELLEQLEEERRQARGAE
jgi:hypothetical protein